MSIVGIILIICSGVAIIYSLLRKNERLFNIREVFSNHLAAFKEDKYQYITFYVLPAAFAVGLSLIYCADNEFYTELSVIVGILTSILFAVLSILSSYDFSNVKDNVQREKVLVVVKETINSIIFNTVLCVFLMLYNLAMVISSSLVAQYNILSMFFSAISYYTFTVIILTLLYLVKQMTKIIEFNLLVTRK